MMAATLATTLGIIGTVAGLGASVYSTISSNKQAKKTAAQQAAYQQSLLDQQTATEAEEKRIQTESTERNRAYGASLVEGNTQLSNALNSSWEDDDDSSSTSILGNTLQSTGVQSIFA